MNLGPTITKINSVKNASPIKYSQGNDEQKNFVEVKIYEHMIQPLLVQRGKKILQSSTRFVVK